MKFEEIMEVLIFIFSHPRQALKIGILVLKKWFKRIKLSYVLVFLCLFSIVFCAVQVERLNKRTHLFQFISTNFFSNSKDFIADNAFYPNPQDVNFAVKKDLVVVLAESLETSFFDPKISSLPMESKLKKHLDSSLHVSNFLQLNNSSWTIAAMTGWHFGLPLKLPSFVDGNQYHSRRGFLPGAKSIFEIFEKNGYKLVLVLGSDSNYSGKRSLFNLHGKFTILDRQYWQMQGWSLEENSGTGWGFNDDFVLQRAFEEYKKLKESGQPFVLFVETVDTHAPDGYAPEERRKFGDIRDPFLNADFLLDKFASEVKGFDSSNTALAIIGDHLFMGNPGFLPRKDKRRIFNLFWSPNIKQGFELKEDKNISALDIAPTLLELAGGRWENHQYGLGISIFSKEPNLVERFGVNKLNNELSKRSHFYNQLY